MTLTAGVAMYAAGVGTAGLIWQAYVWRANRRNRVAVDLRMGFGKEKSVPIDEAQAVRGRIGPAIHLVVRNLGSHPIRPVGAGIEITTTDGDRVLVHAREGPLIEYLFPGKASPADRSISPNDASSASFEMDELEDEGLDRKAPMRGWVDLASGERFTSPRLSLYPRPTDAAGNFLPEKL